MDCATTKLNSSTPILYVAPCDLILGRVPLVPYFLQGNAAPTIPHQLLHLKASAFQYWISDAAAVGATCTRSTHGCGSLGDVGLAWGICLGKASSKYSPN